MAAGDGEGQPGSRPGVDAAVQVVGIKAKGSEQRGRCAAAMAAAAHDHDRGVAVQFTQAAGELGQRDVVGAFDAAGAPLVRLTHIQDDQLVALSVGRLGVHQQTLSRSL